MSSEEQSAWIYLTVAVIVPVVYAVHIVRQLAAAAAVSEIAFQRPLLIAVGGGILASIVARMFLPQTAALRDERDRDITRLGEYVGFFVIAYGLLPAFALALLEADHFWIANAIYAAYILNAITSSVVKLVAYRRGL